MSKKIWSHTPESETDIYLGVLEFKDTKEEFHDFEVIRSPSSNRLVFGGACNTCLLQSGYMEIEEYESADEALSELLSDLETYYNDGPSYVSRIVCNDRM